ncbi:Cation-transporting P-type ATPase [Trypanosoma melophagium]|uniref:Cation-transporting P-type ATPase n=1 Tax=Trypanosoma melophagium TaxID=715481 RepID=UPI00351A9281|nr:Cation-transporting P-type ATPase [Trypanosoma melophagium]
MDTLAALALATEEPTEECLNRGPTSRKAPLVSNRMWCTIGSVAAVQIVSTLVLDIYGQRFFPYTVEGQREHKTLLFNVFVYGTLFHMFNARKLYRELNPFEGFQRSKLFIFILAFCVIFQAVAVSTFGELMKVRRLSLAEWGCSLAVAVITLPVGVLSRLVYVPEPVFPRTPDEDVDQEVRRFVDQLSSDVEKVRLENGAAGGDFLQLARRMHAQSLWRQVQGQRVKTLRVVNAFRRAKLDGDMRSSFSKNLYHCLRQQHQ